MNRTVLRTALLIAYWIPFGFLAMYGDRELGTMWLYAFAVVYAMVLCWACMRYRCPQNIVGGNVITAVSSYMCLSQVLNGAQGELWGAYFKPFSPLQMLLFLTIVGVVLQLIFLRVLKLWHLKKANLTKK